MSVSSDIQARIIATAGRMYEALERERFPKVEDVRREAHVSMNDAVAVMKQWRRDQTTAPTSVTIVVPEEVQRVFQTSLGDLWQTASAQANESLTNAKKAWDDERGDYEQQIKELSQAYDDLSEEKDKIESERDEAQNKQSAAQDALEKADRKLINSLENEQNLSTEVSVKATQINALEGQLKQAGEEHSELLKRLDRLTEDLEKAHKDLAEARNGIADRDAKISEINNQLKDALKAAKDNADKADAAVEREDEAARKLSETVAERDRIRQEREAERQKATEREQHLNEAKDMAVVDAAKAKEAQAAAEKDAAVSNANVESLKEQLRAAEQRYTEVLDRLAATKS